MQHFYCWKNQQNSRYYTLEYKQDLLGDWVLIKAYGRTGTRLGQTRQVVCKDYQEGLIHIQRIQKTRIKHGYTVSLSY